MKFNTFEEFINEIKITLVAFQSNPNNMTPRLEIIFKGVFKLINDDEIMAAYKLIYDKHLLIREIICNALWFRDKASKAWNIIILIIPLKDHKSEDIKVKHTAVYED